MKGKLKVFSYILKAYVGLRLDVGCLQHPDHMYTYNLFCFCLIMQTYIDIQTLLCVWVRDGIMQFGGGHNSFDSKVEIQFRILTTAAEHISFLRTKKKLCLALQNTMYKSVRND